MMKPWKKHTSRFHPRILVNGEVVVEKKNPVITLGWQLWLPTLIYSPQIRIGRVVYTRLDCEDEIDQMLKISLKEAQTEEEVFFSVAWVRAFNIREPIYPELCREFYATYEFDEVCADNELQRLGLYHADELEEEGFDTYFQGGLRSDENFNAREY
ncbi:hypothetical protein Tco_0290554 [Tanacetum coccineum]